LDLLDPSLAAAQRNKGAKELKAGTCAELYAAVSTLVLGLRSHPLPEHDAQAGVNGMRRQRSLSRKPTWVSSSAQIAHDLK